MDRLAVLHTFESDSTFLVGIPSATLRSSTGSVPEAGISSSTPSGEKRMSGGGGRTDLTSLVDLPPGCSDGDREDRELGIVRIVPVSGSVAFHSHFLNRFEAYCSLARRLRRAIEWLLLSIQEDHKQNNSSPKLLGSSMFDVDCLTHVSHPVEPTAYLAAAFALPLVVSASPTSQEEEEFLDRREELGSTDKQKTVPYCFFYAFPEQRVLRGAMSLSSPTERPGMTVIERFTAVAKATGVCGIVPPAHNALSINNRTKVGLTLLAYVEGCLPHCVLGGGSSEQKSCGGKETDHFSLWSDDILWRLLCSLVSALAVVHANGFHYCGELSLADVLCFAIPGDNDTGVAEAEALMSGECEGGTQVPVGQRFLSWAAASERHWVITNSTPAHRAFFMLTTPPRSLFVNYPDDPFSVAEAQKSDIVAAGCVVLRVVEEMKQRRRPSDAGACSELLFVAQRMISLREGSDRSGRGEFPSVTHRFAQLQVVRLRTHLCLLRSVVEERNAQLAAAINYGRNTGDPKEGGIGRWAHERNNDRDMAGRGVIATKRRSGYDISSASSSTQKVASGLTAKSVSLRERERVLAEREEKLSQFLVLYELTAEQLDQLPGGSKGFESLKQMLTLSPGSSSDKSSVKPTSSARASSKNELKGRTPVSSMSKSRSVTPKTSRDLVRRGTPLMERRQPSFANFCLSKSKDVSSPVGAGSTPGTTTISSTLLKPSVNGGIKERRVARSLYKQPVVGTHSDSSQWCSSTGAEVPSTLHRGGSRAPPSARGGNTTPQKTDSADPTAGTPAKKSQADSVFVRTPNRRELSERTGNAFRTLGVASTKGLLLSTNHKSTSAGIISAGVARPGSLERDPLRSLQAVHPERHAKDSEGAVGPLAGNSLLKLSARSKTPQPSRAYTGNAKHSNTLSGTSGVRGPTSALTAPRDPAGLSGEVNIQRTSAEGYLTSGRGAESLGKEALPAGSEGGAASVLSPVAGDDPVTCLEGALASLKDDIGGVATVTDSVDNDQQLPDGEGWTDDGRPPGHRDPNVPSYVPELPVRRIHEAAECGSLSGNGAISERNSLEGHRPHSDRRSAASSQQPSGQRADIRTERDGPRTPRSLRSRVQDGWVDTHLAALEQMRSDFHQTEVIKSARNPPGVSAAESPTVHLTDSLEPLIS
uniref:WGS project CAEQ00000000 data, annotated contig 497 n=1 Tax=Trypanosoma congolense (strain IL3000) TaxID=1068625 RepID=F9WGF6_TRYCI|nr:unnamed protein product [Trypanosoma congolense IL3000]